MISTLDPGDIRTSASRRPDAENTDESATPLLLDEKEHDEWDEPQLFWLARPCFISLSPTVPTAKIDVRISSSLCTVLGTANEQTMKHIWLFPTYSMC